MSDGAVCADVYTQRGWHAGPGVHRPTLNLLDTQLIRSRVCMGLSFPGVGWGWRLGTGRSAQPPAARARAGARNSGICSSPDLHVEAFL